MGEENRQCIYIILTSFRSHSDGGSIIIIGWTSSQLIDQMLRLMMPQMDQKGMKMFYSRDKTF